MSSFLPTCSSPSLLPSCPVSPFVCTALCGVGQPADLFDSGASGSLPREPSSLFSEGPLVVAPEKRGGQVWRETEIRLETTRHLSSDYPQSTRLVYMPCCSSCKISYTRGLQITLKSKGELRVVILPLAFVAAQIFMILFLRDVT